MRDPFNGLLCIWFVTLITIPLNLPYGFNQIFLGYCFVTKYGGLLGFLAFLPLDPFNFSSACMIPFFFSRLFCKKTIRRMFKTKMRVFRALNGSSKTHGLKLVTLITMAPVCQEGINYLLASSKVGVL